jgi:hypothetical protein
MHATCCEDPCGCEESAFARLRYSYGQRLTAVDLLDEQSYLIGKDRFLARHVLGAGILCGLRALRADGPPEHTPMLRVTRGAALDLCGRGIVVEHDQCLDVAAWYAQRRDELGWTKAGTFPAWVGLRYRECPSDPVRVPGDPCGCDGDGCAYTRIHESFELALHPDGGQAEPALAPGGWSALCGDITAGRVPLGPEACPPCACDGWLLVAAVDVVLEAPPGGVGLRAVDIGTPQESDPRRLTLLSLAALQRLALGLGAGGEGCAPGPTLGAMTGEGDLAADGTLAQGRMTLDVVLAPGPDGTPSPLDASTATLGEFRLLEPSAAGWTPIELFLSYVPDDSTFRLGTEAAKLDEPYRLVFRDDIMSPTVDEQWRPLRPTEWSRGLRWTVAEDGETVTLVTTP